MRIHNICFYAELTKSGIDGQGAVRLAILYVDRSF